MIEDANVKIYTLIRNWGQADRETSRKQQINAVKLYCGITEDLTFMRFIL